MNVAPAPAPIDLFGMLGTTSGGRGTVVAVVAALTLLLGRLLLWLLVQLVKFLVLLAIVGTLLAVGFEVGSNWDALSGAAPATEVHVR